MMEQKSGIRPITAQRGAVLVRGNGLCVICHGLHRSHAINDGKKRGAVLVLYAAANLLQESRSGLRCFLLLAVEGWGPGGSCPTGTVHGRPFEKTFYIP